MSYKFQDLGLKNLCTKKFSGRFEDSKNILGSLQYMYLNGRVNIFSFALKVSLILCFLKNKIQYVSEKTRFNIWI